MKDLKLYVFQAVPADIWIVGIVADSVAAATKTLQEKRPKQSPLLVVDSESRAAELGLMKAAYRSSRPYERHGDAPPFWILRQTFNLSDDGRQPPYGVRFSNWSTTSDEE